MTALATYPSNFTSRTLELCEGTDGLKIRILTPFSSPVGIDLAEDHTIELAKQILTRLAPDALVPPPFSETPVGTWLRHKNSGKIVRAMADLDSDVNPTPDSLRVEDENGHTFRAVQHQRDPLWVKLNDDQVEVKTVWDFKA